MNKELIKATAERAVKTFAQTLVALVGTGAAGITNVNWATDLSVAATAAILSVVTSVASVSPIIPPAKAPGVDIAEAVNLLRSVLPDKSQPPVAAVAPFIPAVLAAKAEAPAPAPEPVVVPEPAVPTDAAPADPAPAA